MHYHPWRFSATCPKFSPHTPIFYDSEFVRERFFYPKLALAQIHQAHWQHTLIFDPLAHDIKPSYQSIAEHNGPLVAHAGTQDLELFYAYSGFLPQSFRDTQIGFSLLHPNATISYRDLVYYYLDIRLPKEETRSDWLARPLSQAQCDYASNDVSLLAKLYPLLLADLKHHNRLHWWQEESLNLLHNVKQEIAPQYWYQLRNAPQLLRPIDYPFAQTLIHLRERIAQKYDLPRRNILRDDALIKLAQKHAQTAEELAKYIDVESTFNEALPFYHEQLKKEQQTPTKTPERNPRLNPKQKQQLYRLEKHTRRTAKSLGIHPRILANQKQLYELLQTPEKSALSKGWRAEFFSKY